MKIDQNEDQIEHQNEDTSKRRSKWRYIEVKTGQNESRSK